MNYFKLSGLCVEIMGLIKEKEHLKNRRNFLTIGFLLG